METKQAASEVIWDQHVTICKAIAYLQNDVDAMTSEIHPDTTSWRDVSKYAHVADIAAGIVARYEEQ